MQALVSQPKSLRPGVLGESVWGLCKARSDVKCSRISLTMEIEILNEAVAGNDKP